MMIVMLMKARIWMNKMKNTTILIPERNTIPYNCSDGYKEQVTVDSCLKEEILNLWSFVPSENQTL